MITTQIEFIRDATSLICSAHRCDCADPIPVYQQAIKILRAIPTENIPYSEVRSIYELIAEAEAHIDACLN